MYYLQKIHDSLDSYYDMSSVQVDETSVNVITNSPSQDYTQPEDHTPPTYETKLL